MIDPNVIRCGACDKKLPSWPPPVCPHCYADLAEAGIATAEEPQLKDFVTMVAYALSLCVPAAFIGVAAAVFVYDVNVLVAALTAMVLASLIAALQVVLWRAWSANRRQVRREAYERLTSAA